MVSAESKGWSVSFLVWLAAVGIGCTTGTHLAGGALDGDAPGREDVPASDGVLDEGVDAGIRDAGDVCPPGVGSGAPCSTEPHCVGRDEVCTACGSGAYVLTRETCFCTGGSWRCEPPDVDCFGPGDYCDPACTRPPGSCGDDGGTHVDAADAPPACPTELGGPCNVVLQCGCAAGERCVLVGLPDDPVEACVPAGTDRPGTPCGAGDNCTAQSQCFEVPGPDAECTTFCYDMVDCRPGLFCSLGIDGVPGYRLCTPEGDCDPFSAAGCPFGEGCMVYPGGSCETACSPAGSGTVGEECESSGCAIGLGCYTVTGGPPYHCYKFCAPAGVPDCADIPGATCLAIDAGCPEFGVCFRE
ncbi:MAG: hypothetical protein HY907_21745 [Deltaproteobacteria bacterium]|nr:hypothetical protein [Deltaproteobacteria bacterium]